MKDKVESLAIFVFILSALIVSWCIEVQSKESIIGVWQGKSQATELLFEFNADGTCLLSFKNSDSNETDKLSGTFEVDFSKDPIPLSIRNIPQLDHGLYTIIKFSGEGSLVIADFAPRWRLRPVSYEYDPGMSLRRVHEG